jgi:hypothetical protein
MDAGAVLLVNIDCYLYNNRSIARDRDRHL